jgi:hypothetical protein
MKSTTSAAEALLRLRESAKRLKLAELRMKQAEKEAKALDVLCEAFEQWRAEKTAAAASGGNAVLRNKPTE